MNNNPVHNRRRLARRIWKRLVTGYFYAVVIEDIAIAKEGKQFTFETRNGDKQELHNAYEFLIEQIRTADDIRCFSKKRLNRITEWNALCFTKAYTYKRLGRCSDESCYLI